MFFVLSLRLTKTLEYLENIGVARIFSGMYFFLKNDDFFVSRRPQYTR